MFRKQDPGTLIICNIEVYPHSSMMSCKIPLGIVPPADRLHLSVIRVFGSKILPDRRATMADGRKKLRKSNRSKKQCV
jgi:hypothetical protein